MDSNTVYIYAVPRESAQKRHQYTHWNGKKLNKTKAASAYTSFSPSVSSSKGMLNTGFWELEVNPYYSESEEAAMELGLPNAWIDKGVYKRKKITRQEYLEIKHHREPGFYTSISPKPVTLGREKGFKPTFLQSFIYMLNDGLTVLDLDDPRDEIMYYLAIQSPKIANSFEEIGAFTDFYIAKVNESEERKATKRRQSRKATAALVDLIDTKGINVARKVAVVLKLIKGVVSNEALENTLDDFINQAEDRKKSQNIQKFMDVYELLGSKAGKERLDAMFILQNALNERIITQSRGRHTWHLAPSEELQLLGNTKDEAINHILDPEFKKYKQQIVEQIQQKQASI